MNERIIELAKKAGLRQPHGSDREYIGDLDWRMFAELLIRECALFLEENSGYDDSNNAWHPEPEDMLKHFGVE